MSLAKCGARAHCFGARPSPCPASPQLRRTGLRSRQPAGSLHALGSGLGDGATSSPFALLDQQMRLMNDQMRGMDREFIDMERQMKRELEQTLQDSRSLTDQLNRDANSQVSRARQAAEQAIQQAKPDVSIQRSEQRGPGSYRYYETIQIRSGYAVPYHTMAAQPTLASGPGALMLAAALILSGAYVAVSATFNKSYDRTTFRPDARWKLLLTWPILLVFSGKFREQFVAVMQGRPAPSVERGEEGRNT